MWNSCCFWLERKKWRVLLTEINTNIDLGKLESKDFKFDTFVDFLKDNNFNHVLGLRNVAFEDNPSPVWTDKLKETLKSNSMDYDEYVVDEWPSPIPEFDVPDNIFILRYSYDPQNKLDELAVVSTGLKRISLIINESEDKNLWVIVKIAFFASLL